VRSQLARALASSWHCCRVTVGRSLSCSRSEQGDWVISSSKAATLLLHWHLMAAAHRPCTGTSAYSQVLPDRTYTSPSPQPAAKGWAEPPCW
jgi:hypothetical protein